MAYLTNRPKGSKNWVLTVIVGYRPDGSKITKSKTVKGLTKTQAKRELAKFDIEVKAGEYITPEKIYFSDFVQDWHDKYAAKHLSLTTLDIHMRIINNRLIPVFGHMPLDKIKAIHIINFLDELEKNGKRLDGKKGKLSSATIQYHYRVLRNIFNRAVEWQILKDNPMTSVKQPKVEHKKKMPYDEVEIEMVKSVLAQCPIMWRIIITLAITTGMRRAEIAGLQWKNIDFENETIFIEHNLVYVKGHGSILKPPKNKNSIRTISIPSVLMDLLKEYKQLCDDEKENAGELWEEKENYFVFSAWNGKPLYPKSISQYWNRLKKKHGLRNISLHDLRHTSATILLNKGVHAKVIADRLGHANIKTTMDIYAHVLRSADKAAAKHFDSLFDQ